MRFGGALGHDGGRVALLFLLSISCGSTASRGRKPDASANGAAGSSSAGLGGLASQAGGATSNSEGGTSGTNPGGMSGGASQVGEAGEGGTLSGAAEGGAGGWSYDEGEFRFEIIPSLDPSGPLRDSVLYSGQWVSASADGAVLAGVSAVYDDAATYSPSGVRFLWTADRKTEALPSGSPESGLFEAETMNEDGTSLFGRVSKFEQLTPTSSSFGPVSFFRWTRAGGDVRFGPPDSMISGQIDFVSADGKTAVGAVAHTVDEYLGFRWTEGSGFAYLSDLGWPPDATPTAISGDGEVIALNRDPTQPFIWSEANQFVALGTLPDFSYCLVGSLSRDGNVALGSCSDTSGDLTTTFRWTTDGGLVDLSLPGYADSTSDGGVAVGTDGLALYRWTEGKQTRKFEPPLSWAAGARYSISLNPGASLSRDGSTLRGRFLLDDGTPEWASYPFRWNEADGFVRLEPLPNHAHGAVVAQTSDGSVQAGVCWSGKERGEAVLWDRYGVRDIARELTEAGIDLHGLQLESVSYVWSGSSLMVAGAGVDREKTGNGHAWIAWLPKRR
ncbi:MAG: hypothetical protein ABUL60_20865 [Myxococcales bacterium]